MHAELMIRAVTMSGVVLLEKKKEEHKLFQEILSTNTLFPRRENSEGNM